MESTESGGKGKRDLPPERRSKIKAPVERTSTRRRTRRATTRSRCPAAGDDRTETERERLAAKRSVLTRPSLRRRKASCPDILLSRQDFTKLTLPALVKLVKIEEVDLETLALAGKFPLHDAVARGFVEIVRVLVKYLRDINLPSREGLTPLEVAVQTGNFECAELLITHGASMVDIQDGFKKRTRSCKLV